MCNLKQWEFEDSQGFKWIVKGSNNKLNVEVVTFKSVMDWEMLDELQAEGKLRFIKESELDLQFEQCPNGYKDIEICNTCEYVMTCIAEG